jgi:hypothetical protein
MSRIMDKSKAEYADELVRVALELATFLEAMRIEHRESGHRTTTGHHQIPPTGRGLVRQYERRRARSTNSIPAVRSTQEHSGLRLRKDHLRRNF